MIQLYRCSYCDFTGSKKEVLTHEKECFKNPNNRGCLTCAYCSKMVTYVKCKKGKEIEEGKYIQQCSLYEDGQPTNDSIFGNLFGNLFDGVNK